MSEIICAERWRTEGTVGVCTQCGLTKDTIQSVCATDDRSIITTHWICWSCGTEQHINIGYTGQIYCEHINPHIIVKGGLIPTRRLGGA